MSLSRDVAILKFVDSFFPQKSDSLEDLSVVLSLREVVHKLLRAVWRGEIF